MRLPLATSIPWETPEVAWSHLGPAAPNRRPRHRAPALRDGAAKTATTAPEGRRSMEDTALPKSCCVCDGWESGRSFGSSRFRSALGSFRWPTLLRCCCRPRATYCGLLHHEAWATVRPLGGSIFFYKWQRNVRDNWVYSPSSLENVAIWLQSGGSFCN